MIYFILSIIMGTANLVYFLMNREKMIYPGPMALIFTCYVLWPFVVANYIYILIKKLLTTP